MFEGFIPGSRASFLMDALVIAMAFILVVLAFSIKQAQKKQYQNHKKIQVTCGIILILAVIAFEVEVRFFGWREHAKVSPYFDTTLFPFLYFHIVWATLAVIFWGMQIFQSFKNIGKNMARPPEYSAKHRRTGKISILLMFGTAVTGWIFYYMAFMAI